MAVRDYPHPLVDILEVTISGRIIFAEQEAQERGNYSFSLKGRAVPNRLNIAVPNRLSIAVPNRLNIAAPNGLNIAVP